MTMQTPVNWDLLKTRSVLEPVSQLGIPKVNAIKNELDRQLMRNAERLFSGTNVIIRDLVATDLPGYTNNVFSETSGAQANEWAATTGGDGTAVSEHIILGILGVRIASVHEALPITAFRFRVGATTNAQWSLYRGYNVYHQVEAGTPADAFGGAPIATSEEMYTLSPIIVTKQQTLLIEEYVAVTGQAYVPVWIGRVVEQVGRNLDP